MHPRLTEEQVAALSGAVLDLVDSQPHGLSAYAAPHGSPYVIAKDLVRLSCGITARKWCLLAIPPESTEFLHDYFRLRSRFMRLTATAKLTTVINKLIVARRLTHTVDYDRSIISNDGSELLRYTISTA